MRDGHAAVAPLDAVAADFIARAGGLLRQPDTPPAAGCRAPQSRAAAVQAQLPLSRAGSSSPAFRAALLRAQYVTMLKGQQQSLQQQQQADAEWFSAYSAAQAAPRTAGPTAGAAPLAWAEEYFPRPPEVAEGLPGPYGADCEAAPEAPHAPAAPEVDPHAAWLRERQHFLRRERDPPAPPRPPPAAPGPAPIAPAALTDLLDSAGALQTTLAHSAAALRAELGELCDCVRPRSQQAPAPPAPPPPPRQLLAPPRSVAGGPIWVQRGLGRSAAASAAWAAVASGGGFHAAAGTAASSGDGPLPAPAEEPAVRALSQVVPRPAAADAGIADDCDRDCSCSSSTTPPPLVPDPGLPSAADSVLAVSLMPPVPPTTPWVGIDQANFSADPEHGPQGRSAAQTALQPAPRSAGRDLSAGAAPPVSRRSSASTLAAAGDGQSSTSAPTMFWGCAARQL
eukprot:TRINITY_DN44708_c0_g1_i1.p1 TRINITY_DN44708_c0_g1~~TRINITY_DN44708_c0_g1_i1.p1  ORF type:complete len:476 (+),score=108.74 TRINITY_DN44708_c0_g1_i1:71-1429(+)